MEDQKNIHYRVGGKLTHCGCECLPEGKDIERIIIARIEYKEEERINGRVENGVWVAYFAPNPYTTLPFILNSTNRKRLAKMYPECNGYIARLENVPVRLTREITRDANDGGDTWGLRISKLPPAAEAAPKPAATAKKKVVTEDKIQAVIDWALKNNLSMEDIAAKYDFESGAVKDAIADGISIAVPGDDLPDA